MIMFMITLQFFISENINGFLHSKNVVPPVRDDWAIIRLIAGKSLEPNIPNNGGNARYGWSNVPGMVKSVGIGLSNAAKLPSVKCVQRLSES